MATRSLVTAGKVHGERTTGMILWASDAAQRVSQLFFLAALRFSGIINIGKADEVAQCCAKTWQHEAWSQPERCMVKEQSHDHAANRCMFNSSIAAGCSVTLRQ
jgi:hypothetical protein